MAAGGSSTEVQLKLLLMRAIDEDLKSRYRTITAAADDLGEDEMRLCRLGNGHHALFSFKWLFRLADSAKVHIRISVDRVNR